MFESVTAWRYLFRPRFTPGRLVFALLTFITGAGGMVIQALAPRPLTLVLLLLGVGGALVLGGGIGWLALRGSEAQRILSALVMLGGVVLVGAGLVWIMRPASEYVGAGLGAVGFLLFVVACLLFVFTMFTVVSILAVFVAVSTMVMVRSVTNGFSQEFKDKVLGFNAHVLVMKWGYGLTEYPEVISEVKRIPHVTGAAPFTIADMLVAKGSEHTHVLMKGVQPHTVGEVLDLKKYVRSDNAKDLQRRIDSMGWHLDKGALGAGQTGECKCKTDPDGDCIPGSRRKCKLPGIMIGTRLAERLMAKVGDIVRLISPMAEIQKLRGEVRGGPPVARDFRVVGLFYCGFEEYDQKLVFVHLKAAQHFLNPGSGPDKDAVLGVEIKLDDIYAATEVAKAIEKRLGGKPYRVITWMQLNKPLFSALRTQRLIMIIISAILLMVAAFCILAALAMMVIDKTREVTILRSMGGLLGRHRAYLPDGEPDYRLRGGHPRGGLRAAHVRNAGAAELPAGPEGVSDQSAAGDGGLQGDPLCHRRDDGSVLQRGALSRLQGRGSAARGRIALRIRDRRASSGRLQQQQRRRPFCGPRDPPGWSRRAPCAGRPGRPGTPAGWGSTLPWCSRRDRRGTG